MTSAGDTDFEWVLALFHEACREVLSSAEVFAQESQRENPPRLAWPPPVPTDGAENLQAMLAQMAFAIVMGSIRQAEGADVDPSSDRFQLILRMIRRTLDVTLEKCQRDIGPGRVSGIRVFKNKLTAALVENAVRSGRGVEVAGISKSAAYRALGRKGAKQ